MFKIGLKLWSTNKQYINDAVRLYEEGYCDYIELFSVPNSYDDYVGLWKSLNVPFVIHAPHSDKGMCLSKAGMVHENMKLAFEALKFADTLKAPWIVFHSGVDGDLRETARQFNMIQDPRILVENKPLVGLAGQTCNGTTPEDIAFLKNEAGVGFCLDVGHAIYAANAHGRDQKNMVQEFLALKPTMFHMTDGEVNGVRDMHYHFGAGSYDFSWILELLPVDATISIECPHSFQDSLVDFKSDAVFVKKLAKKDLERGIEFRRATWKDVNNLFDLANDSDVRLNSFSQEKIPVATHLQWFREHLEDSHSLLFVIMKRCEFIGTVRFDLENHLMKDIAKISISLNKRFRRCGAGSLVLKQALILAQREGIKTIKAHIFDHNIASKQIFIGAGFVECGEGNAAGRVFFRYQKNLDAYSSLELEKKLFNKEQEHSPR